MKCVHYGFEPQIAEGLRFQKVICPFCGASLLSDEEQLKEALRDAAKVDVSLDRVLKGGVEPARKSLGLALQAG